MITGGMTSFLQTLDVAISEPYKDRLKHRWEDWMANDRAYEERLGDDLQMDPASGGNARRSASGGDSRKMGFPEVLHLQCARREEDDMLWEGEALSTDSSDSSDDEDELADDQPHEINKPIYGDGTTPLMWACYNGADIRIIDILIDAGGQVGAKDCEGLTALHLAVWRRRLQAVELLLSRGSNVNEKTNRGNTPLHLAADSFPEWTDGVKAIMNQSAVEVNPRDKDGQTPLHWACDQGNFHTVGLLLGHNGIDVNVVDNNGDTPLHLAVWGHSYHNPTMGSLSFFSLSHCNLLY
ncbi:repeat domain-containing 65-like isoform X2 [Octopus vulgaris]|uniref:Repeat domain-containing 65-like isoform X2 n=1 Tax=Octopus vulgaris TaxID=6645 RepID=A0AA36MIM6_OCTVU|nr:repeat domain-containing 65-like isoform X2 [Octopus vulgaris]